MGGVRMRYGKRARLRVRDGGLLVLVAALFAGMAGEASASVVRIDLGTLGGNVSEAYDVNASGQVVGQSDTGDGTWHAFSWTQAGGMVDLGTLLGGAHSCATAVNASGRVVGWSETSDGSTHAFSWTQAGGMADLGTLDGASSSALALSASGQVVGWSYTADGALHAFSWTQVGGMVDLGLGTATAVNAGGQVVGQDGSSNAFLWTQAGGMVNLGPSAALAVSDSGQVVGRINFCLPICCHETCSLGVCVCKWVCSEECRTEVFSWTQAGGKVDLSTLGGSNGWPIAVNASGQVVGTSETADGLTHAFLWTETGGMVDLGTLGGTRSDLGSRDHFFHNALNASGQVVGWSETSDGSTHAFSWTEAGGMVDLGTLAGTESEALAVNDRGDIVGYSAMADGSHHAVLWKLKPLIATPTDMSLGKVLKDASSDQAIKVKNTGTAPLTISFIGSPAPPFSIAGGTCTAPQVLPSSGSCTIVVRFSPTAQEPASSSFNITSDDPVEDSMTVHLSGRGVILLAKPDEVTIGSEVTITGAGFGTSKGNVLIGGVALKITEWTDREIKGTLRKAPTPDFLSNVVVQPKVPKGTPAITEPAGFTARGPRITSVDPRSGISGGPSLITIHGNLFSTKKGRVTLDPGSGGKVKSCKVLSWAMEEIKFLVPKGLTAGTDYTLGVSNSVGSDTRTFGVAAP